MMEISGIMSYRFFIYCIVLFSFIGCNSDPCLEENNIDCETGDADGDGIFNSNDISPLDPCLPNDNPSCPTGDLDNDGTLNSLDPDSNDRCNPGVPPLRLNIIGTWSFSLTQNIEFLNDGTYKDLQDSGILSLINEEVAERYWRIETENVLTLEVVGTLGKIFKVDFHLASNECDEIVFGPPGFELELQRIK